METMTDYTKKGADFLSKAGISFEAIYTDERCPRFCDGNHIHGSRFEIIFKRANGKELRFDFWDSWQDKQDRELLKARPMSWDRTHAQDVRIKELRKRGIDIAGQVKPSAYDVLACITKNDPEDFENFCAEYGYDPDSIKAEQTFKAVDHEWHKVRRFFTDEELEQLCDIQ